MDAHRRYAATVGIFATALYLALLVCVFGFISLLTDTEVIPQADAGLVIGPVMTGAAVAVVLVALVLRTPRLSLAGRRSAPGFAALTGLIAWAAYGLVGGAAYGVTVGAMLAGAPFAAQAAVGGYGIAVGLLAFLVAWIDTAVLASRFEERGRPRWPWERDAEE